MALTDAQKNDFNKELNEGFKAVMVNNWLLAESHFDKAFQLINTHCKEIPFKPHSLPHFLFLLKYICKYQHEVTTGKVVSACDEYLKKTGYVFHAEHVKMAPPLYQALLLQLVNNNPWITITLTEKEFNQVFLKDLNYAGWDFLKALNTIYQTYSNVNKSYYLPHLTHEALGIPTYLDYILAANDVYERSTTSADPHTPHCKFIDPNPVPTLKSRGWKLIKTAHTIPGYKNDEYFGKVYIDDVRKMVLIAHKGTSPTCKNDLEQDHHIFKRRLPQKYFDQANKLLEITRNHLTAKGKTDYKLFMTGHSLGGAMAELLSCQHNIACTTFDSPGTQQIIEYNSEKFKITDKTQAPITGVLSLDNLFNTCNGHMGRLLQIGKCRKLSYALPIPNITILSLLKDFIKWSTKTSVKNSILMFITEDDFNNISSVVMSAVDTFLATLKTHSLELFLNYFIHDYPHFQPYGLYTITAWPNGIQDGNTLPEIIQFHERIIALSYFTTGMQIILKHLDEVIADPAFPSNYNMLKEMLQAITLTDRYGGEFGNKDHVLIKGALTIDEFRLFLWDYFTKPEHKNLQAFLLTYINKYKDFKAMPAAPSQGLLSWLMTSAKENPIPAAAVATIAGGLAFSLTKR